MMDSVGDAQPSSRAWDGRTRTGVGILIFYYGFRLLGPWFAYGLLYPVVFYYLLFAGRGGRASRDYLRRRFPGVGAARVWWLCYRHFLSFGRVLLDRAYAFTGLLHKLRFERRGDGALDAALAEGKGVILVSAHVGNWELAAFTLARKGVSVPVSAVMYRGEQEQVERRLKRASGELPFRVIASNDSLGAGIECVTALQRGEIVAMHGDRVLGESGVPAEFLGGTARFPAGPWVLAATTGAPVVLVFNNRLGRRRYRLTMLGPFRYEFTDRESRRAELEQWAREYAAALEQVLEEFALQWHNFYPFWEA